MLQLQFYIIHSLEMLDEMQIPGLAQTNQIRMCIEIYIGNKLTRCFWDSWASCGLSADHLENLCSFVFVICYINNEPLCIRMCPYMNNCFGVRITGYIVFSYYLLEDRMRLKGGSVALFLQSFLFSLTFFIWFMYYSYGDSSGYLDRGLQVIALFHEFLFIL